MEKPWKLTRSDGSKMFFCGECGKKLGKNEDAEECEWTEVFGAGAEDDGRARCVRCRVDWPGEERAEWLRGVQEVFAKVWAGVDEGERERFRGFWGKEEREVSRRAGA